MGDQGEESSPASCAAAFHRSGRDVKDRGGFRDGVALHIDEDERGTLFLGKGAQGAEQLSVQILALGGHLSGFLGLEKLLQPLGLGDGRGAPGGGFTGSVQTGIDRDAVQPCGHCGLAAEGVGCPVGGDQGVLHGVGGFLAVTKGAQCHRPEAVAMPPDDLPEGIGVAFYMQGKEIGVGWCRSLVAVGGHGPPGRSCLISVH